MSVNRFAFIHAWSTSSSTTTTSLARKCQACVVSATIVVSSQFFPCLPCNLLLQVPPALEMESSWSSSSYLAHAATVMPATTSTLETSQRVPYNYEDNGKYDEKKEDDSMRAWLDSLSPPTPDRPQIKPSTELLQGSSSATGRKTSSKVRTPLVQGLVYMKDEMYDRLDPSDVIILTVTSVTRPGDILAGAKIPVYKTRIPFNFQFYSENIIHGKEDLYQEIKNEDFIVVANVCPQDAVKIPCRLEESLYEAKGLGKLIQVPGMSESLVVRAPVSLPLEKRNL